jgi:hypothetical protein
MKEEFLPRTMMIVKTVKRGCMKNTDYVNKRMLDNK